MADRKMWTWQTLSHGLMTKAPLAIGFGVVATGALSYGRYAALGPVGGVLGFVVPFDALFHHKEGDR